MTESKLAREHVAALYRQHAAGLRRFLLGVLRDADQADEALQQTFLRVVQKGHTADGETMKGWIYKVAFHQAMALRRRQQAGNRRLAELAGAAAPFGAVLDYPVNGRGAVYEPGSDARAIEAETLRQTQHAVGQLPQEQQEVLHLRIVESKTFAQIAEDLGVPLGTTLTRMRLALEKLRRKLQS